MSKPLIRRRQRNRIAKAACWLLDDKISMWCYRWTGRINGWTYHCEDCGAADMAPMLPHTLWNSVARPNEVLCLPCFENRLGRLVTEEDIERFAAEDVKRFGVENIKRVLDSAPEEKLNANDMTLIRLDAVDHRLDEVAWQVEQLVRRLGVTP